MADPETSASDGPPGGRIFTLEGRRAPGLYVVGWVASLGGIGLLFVGVLADSPAAAVVLASLGLLTIALGLTAGAGSQILDRRDRHPDRYRGPSPLLVFLVFFVALAAVGLILIRSGLQDPDTSGGFVLQGVIQAIGYVLMVWLFAVRSGALSWPQMGWPTWQGPDLRSSLRAIGTAVAVMLPATLIILVVGGLVANLLGVEAPSVLPAPETRSEALLVGISAALLIPIAEELFFRGFALTAWLRDLGPRTALIRSSLFFVVIHLVNVEGGDFAEGLGQVILVLVTLLPVAFVLGRLFLRHGMLGAIGGHVTYNSTLLFLLLLSTYLPDPT